MRDSVRAHERARGYTLCVCTDILNTWVWDSFINHGPKMLLVRAVVSYHPDFGIETWSKVRYVILTIELFFAYTITLSRSAVWDAVLRVLHLTGKLGVSIEEIPKRLSSSRNMKFSFLLPLNSKVWNLQKLELLPATVKEKSSCQMVPTGKCSILPIINMCK